MALSFGAGPDVVRRGPRGTRPHPGSLALAALGPSAVCGPVCGPSLARPWALCAPARAAVGLRLPFRHRCAGQPVARLAALLVGRTARPSLGARRPPAPLAAPVRCGSRAARAPARLSAPGCSPLRLRAAALRSAARRSASAAPPLRLPPPGRAAPLRRACLPRSSRRGGRGLRGGCSPPFYGFAAPGRPAAGLSAAAGKRLRR